MLRIVPLLLAVSLFSLDGEPVDPFDGEAAIRVYLFTSVDCPISNRYAPEVIRLYERYAPQGVRFALVYADPSQGADAIRRHVEEFGYPFPALRDPRHELVERAGATITPEAAVFDAAGRLAYVGRIDDLYVAFGKRRAEPTVHDLAEVLDALLDGKKAPRRTAPAVGCYIPSPE